jgi:nitrogen fixation/metabolism regulation signal transduction histidine kinase
VSERRFRLNYETRLLAGALLAVAPALAGFAIALAYALQDRVVAASVFGAVALLTLALVFVLRRRAVYPLYTLANLLEALREGDYSLRGSRAQRGDAIGEVVLEVNALSQMLREQRLALEEKNALLAKVVATLDIAVLAFDADGRTRLANPAAERLLGAGAAELAMRSAESLGLADCLALDGAHRVERRFAGASGRWDIRHARFRENGRPHDLLVITDLSRALREEERLAWQRLLRVLGHELANSLAPIRSMAGTLAGLARRPELPHDWREDLASGLGVIGARAEALARFMERYTQLARLPPPTPRAVDLAPLAHRVARLEQRTSVTCDGPALVLEADPDQLEQALINLVQNAADAARAGGGHVHLRWRADGTRVLVEIVDDGPGLPPSGNLFVPFFTTKPGGSGIGLVLARQIAEAHGGSLALEEREDTHGCIATLRLPLAAGSSSGDGNPTAVPAPRQAVP